MNPLTVIQTHLAELLALGADKAVLNLGKTARFATTEQYLALLARDRGCAFPGCRVPGKYTIVHHVVPFPNGPTDIDNLVLLCDRHHHLVHEGHWQLQRTPTGWRTEPPARVGSSHDRTDTS